MQNLTVVFDLDGILVDTAPDLVAATNHALAGIDLPPVAAHILRPWISFGARRMIVEALAVSQAHKPEAKVDWPEAKVDWPEAEVDRLLAQFIAYYEVNIARESRPYPGVVEAAHSLRAAGAILAVCTNKRESLSRNLLDALDLAPLFSALAGRDTFPVHKPHPDHLTGAIRLAGGSVDRAVMVGDSDVDIATAKAAGIPVVAVSFGYTQEPVTAFSPDRIIHHYDHLVAAVADLHAAHATAGAKKTSQT